MDYQSPCRNFLESNPEKLSVRFSDLIGPMPIVQSQGDLQVLLQNMAYDSRRVTPDCLFVALKGEHHDGHQFISEGLAKGAKALVVENFQNVPENIPAVAVPNSRIALADLAKRFYRNPSQSMGVIGITGTNGKTTVSYLLERILSFAGQKSGITGTINNRYDGKILKSSLTTPESLDYQKMLYEMRHQGVTFVVSEVSSHALSLQRCLGIEFDLAVFTNLSRDHLEYHGSMENYFAAKAQLFYELLPASSKSKRKAVVNQDDPFGQTLMTQMKLPVCTYSLENSSSSFSCRSYQLGLKGSQAQIQTPEGPKELRSPLLGIHNLRNLLCALAASTSLGFDLDQGLKSLEKFHDIPGRLQKVKPNPSVASMATDREFCKKVLVDYAHTPDALKNVLETLRPLVPKKGKLFCLFGCGGDRDPGKRPLMGTLASQGCDRIILTSDNPRTEDPQKIINEIQKGIPAHFRTLHIQVERKKAIQFAIQSMGQDDLLLIAGKGHEDYQILGKERIAFDDVEIARDTLQEFGLKEMDS